MTSVNKKKKAKNSFIRNGAEGQPDWKCKGIMYFTKHDRNKNKMVARKGMKDEVEGDKQ